MNYKIKQRSSIAGAPILSRPSYSTQRPQSLTTEILAHQLDAFRAGYLREAALTWETMEDRDDTVHISASKRKKAIARHDYEILTVEESAAALATKRLWNTFTPICGSLTLWTKTCRAASSCSCAR